jgi:glycosyltransferase involved in cell wall biosynthesis
MTEGQQRPIVTVYVPSHNYGQYLAQCLQSVFDQSDPRWELIIIDDGSSDQSGAIAASFQARMPERIHILRHATPLGLRACANAALEIAKGDYVLRLDADDYLDENALLVLSHYLEAHPDIGMVYSNWIFVDQEGRIMGLEQRKRAGSEDQLLDLPAHGACSLIRRRVLKAIGGYDTRFSAQDGHELWLKALHRFGAGNVQTPLFFYRQHDTSMSRDTERLLQARRAIKQQLVANSTGAVKPRVVVIVPVKNHYPNLPNLALTRFGHKLLLDYTLDSVCADPRFARVVVSTDDADVLAHCRARQDVEIFQRAARHAEPMVKLADIYAEALLHVEKQLHIFPDIVVALSVHTPLRRTAHIHEAIDTLLLNNVDHVLSTWEDMDLHYRHGGMGLEAVNAGMMNALRLEREALYACNGAIHALWREALTPERFLRGRIGHMVMSKQDSLLAKNPVDNKLLQLLLSET